MTSYRRDSQSQLSTGFMNRDISFDLEVQITYEIHPASFRMGPWPPLGWLPIST
jgi:hypothetical protein